MARWPVAYSLIGSRENIIEELVSELMASCTGERDPLVRLSHVRAARELVPGSALHIFEGCKHWTPKEQPERLSAIAEGLAREM